LKADLLKGSPLKIGPKPTSRPNTTDAYIIPCCVRVWKESQRPHLFLFSAASLSLPPHASFKTSSRYLDCQVRGSNPYHHYHLSLITTSCRNWLHQFTLGIRVPETDRFGSSGIRVIRVPRNWNRSVLSSVSGSGNSVRFRVFPNGTEKKIKKTNSFKCKFRHHFASFSCT
jgi:hypothetical protein